MSGYRWLLVLVSALAVASLNDAVAAKKKSRRVTYTAPTTPQAASRDNGGWERHVTDRQYSTENHVQCDDEGCLYTDHTLYRFEQTNQYYVPNRNKQTNSNVGYGRYETAPLYITNKTAEAAYLTIAYRDGNNVEQITKVNISPGTKVFIAHVAEGSTYGVVGRDTSGSTYDFSGSLDYNISSKNHNLTY